MFELVSMSISKYETAIQAKILLNLTLFHGIHG